MIAEVLLVLAGHSSSLFPSDHTIHPAFAPLLHPGEEQCLESLGQIAFRYRKIKKSCSTLSRAPSRYVALCASLNQILKDEYECLVVETEAKVLRRDNTLVASGSFVPLSSIRATFSAWDAPLAALEALMVELEAQPHWKPGPLIDLLLTRSHTGIYRVASIHLRLCEAVQRVWIAQLQALLIHGSLSEKDPLASKDYVLLDGSVPSCISSQSRDSIMYVGRAIGTVKAAKWEKQFPRDLAIEHTKLLETALPQDQYAFDRIIADIRTTVSEWLWLNVLTHKDVEDAVESLANYFLLRNGEFALSLIREIERLKVSRLTGRTGPSTMIREQDLHLALLRASLGTTAQHDASLGHLRFRLPSGPLRPLLPSLSTAPRKTSPLLFPPHLSLQVLMIFSWAHHSSSPIMFSWPLDLFLHASDLQIYGALFAYLSALRKTHTRIHTCWASLSNAQRARRKWTGLGEGGRGPKMRKELLRCGWGVVREMTCNTSNASSSATLGLDFTTLRSIHATYLERLLTGSLLSNPALTNIIRMILETLYKLLVSFYEQLSISTTQQPFSATADASKSMLYNASMANTTGFHTFLRLKRGKRLEGDEEVRRHIERLLLRLDFNGGFSSPKADRAAKTEGEEILKQGGLA
ncbi:Gamma-tubulin complex component 4 [Grifola frondosa]|uniref:Spindle pole body component n=1 Tax=Grifola frondosa TaxID=5627 RepID=A0A1C7MVA9_GRIFR|nr:Gamma-tubulin complex component 4 [Grifola frondosa]